MVKTLTLDFSDIKNFVKVNTDNFAHVTYDVTTNIAHIDAVFQTDASKNTLMVSRSKGTNNWLLDNMVISEVAMNEEATNYDNGVDLSRYGVTGELYSNDYSEGAKSNVSLSSWNKRQPIGVSKFDHYAGFLEVIEEAKAIIYKATSM